MVFKNVGMSDSVKATSINTDYIKEKWVKESETDAEYDKQRYAAIMEISQEGYSKAQELLEQAQTPNGAIELSDNNCKTLQNLIDTVKAGGNVTKEEEERLNQELQREIKVQYRNMIDLRLENDDERVLKEMKNDYLLKQRTLAEMEEELLQKKLEEETKTQQQESIQNANQIVNKMSEVAMLNQSLDIETNTGNGVKKEDSKQDKSEEGKQENHPLNRAFMHVQEKDKAVKELENRQIHAAKSEKEYSRLLEEEYAKARNVFNNEEFSLQDRVDAYEKFKKVSEEFGVKREVERHRKMFYFETRIAAENELLSNQEIQNAQEKIDEQIKAQSEMLMDEIGRDFIEEKLEERMQNRKPEEKKQGWQELENC